MKNSPSPQLNHTLKRKKVHTYGKQRKQQKSHH